MIAYMLHKNLVILLLLALAIVMRFIGVQYLEPHQPIVVRLLTVGTILFIGTFFVLRKVAKVIEETTEILSEKTKLAGGLLQSFGTAFPDMVLGVVAAIISLRLRQTNFALAVNYAVIAAATTFGSNIYNIGHAAWCIYRQNLANKLDKHILMVPNLKVFGKLKPFREHKVLPSSQEIETSLDVSTALTLLTAIVAISMVLFGGVKVKPEGFTADLYQLIQPVGFVIFIIGVVVLFKFRSTARQHPGILAEDLGGNFYRTKPLLLLWTHLALAGVGILFAAESMVKAIEVFCHITGTPFVIAGVLAGVIGCLGEIIVVHNFSVHPQGRLGDAVVGVAMDNIVTILGASIVAMMGGIFLGGSALILVFVIIFALNTVLIWQISKLKSGLTN
jgi:hypothetical protein